MIYIGAGNTEYTTSPGVGNWSQLSIQEMAYWGATHRAIIKYADLPAAIANATAQVLGIANFGDGNGQLVTPVMMRLITPFTNAADAAQTTIIDIGDNESATRDFNGITVSSFGVNQTLNNPTANFQAYITADVLQVNFRAPAAGKSLSNLTAGEVHVFFRVWNNNLPA